MKNALLLIGVVAVNGLPPRISARTPVARAARADVVRVQAASCAGQKTNRVGTGFAWHSSHEIVTTLHVVAGCKRITIYSERDQVTYNAQVTRVLKRADLALIAVGDRGNFPPIVELATQLAADVELTAWGYGEAAPAMRDFRPMRVANGPATLRQNIPGDAADELARAGSPALDVNVVPIDAVIAPGLSGAPLLDAAGRVRAIADGGVQHGVTHVSWAMPAHYLADLVVSAEPTDVYVSSSANLSAAEETRAAVFGADYIDANAPTISCGSASLRFARSRPFAEVSRGTDSPAGLQQLLGIFSTVMHNFNLDIYEDARSGATVVVPAGARLLSEGPSCRATLLGGQIDMRVSVMSVPLFQDPNILAGQFEMFAATPPTQLWAVDPAWTYYMPFLRPDGLAVRRKAFGHYYPQNQLGVAAEYMFETLAVRGGTFIGVAAIRHNDLALAMCMRGIPGLPCPPQNYLATWAQAALAVHLSTFAISAQNLNGGAWQQRPPGS